LQQRCGKNSKRAKEKTQALMLRMKVTTNKQ